VILQNGGDVLVVIDISYLFRIRAAFRMTEHNIYVLVPWRMLNVDGCQSGSSGDSAEGYI